ncbi:MAG TPA: hypothetical protein VNZ26_15400 [Vicinamibacterales bacterium]|nr:hypothetical protein [Vicinamibacterales bacterium]
MTKFRAAFLACAAVASLLAATTAGQARGTEADTNYLTFSGPVALPGVELRAGTYIFERALPNGDPSLVRVLSRDRRQIFLTAFTNTVRRPESMGPGQVVSLGETTKGVPPPITAWYPLDSSTGHQFLYNR